MQPQVLPLHDPEMVEPLHRQLEFNGVRLELGNGIASIEEQGGRATAVILADGTRLPADLVLLGIGVRPNIALAEAAGIELGASRGIATDDYMRTNDPDIYAVGDAAEYAYGPTGARQRVALAGPANRTGRLAGEHAATGESRPAPGAWGTSIVRVFGTSAGMTGLSLKAAKAAGCDATATHVIANNHAGYYPGAQAMIVEARLRGGHRQGARRPGLRRRGRRQAPRRHLHADALRRHRPRPRRSSTWPTLRRSARPRTPCTWRRSRPRTTSMGSRPWSSPTSTCARTRRSTCARAAEVEALPLADCDDIVNIPLDKLRDRLGELDPSLPTIVACRSGLRSYVATRILKQHGFAEVYNLSGATAMREFALNRRLPATYTTTASGVPGPDAIMID